ncbi:MAG: GuaB1 family IMP dehydrogenase-related protein [Acidimicrobiales bacterium]
MQFLQGSHPSYDLTFDDVFLVPSHSTVSSRFDVDLTSRDGTGSTIPLVVSNMTAVAGRRMAEVVARRGGLAIIPQDIPIPVVADVVKWVKERHTQHDTPLTLSPTATVGDAIGLIHKRSHGAIVVTENSHPVGVVTVSDCSDVDRFTQLHEVMSTDLLVLPATIDPQAAFLRLTDDRHRLAPAVDDEGRLVGLITRIGALRSTLYRPNTDAHGRLRVGAALGINGDVHGRAEALIEAGIDLLVLDTAHGHQEKMLSALASIRSLTTAIPLAAGNVVTKGGVSDLAEAGATIIKVGVGPGAMCTTRMMTGVGRPQLSSILECAEFGREIGVHVWADGGVKHPRDVALALAAGASNVMIGSWFVGTYESPGDLLRDAEGRSYKDAFGMASARAVRSRTSADDAFERARKSLFEEGISTGRIYLDPERPGVEDLIDHIVAGVRSSCTYAGATDLESFYQRAIFGVQSAAGYREGRPAQTGW